VQATATFNSTFSAGLDFKTYYVSSGETNIFNINGIEIDNTAGGKVIPINSVDDSPVPFTVKQMEYFPLSLRYDVNWQDEYGTTTFGVGMNVNLWYWSRISTASGINVTNGTNVVTIPETAYTHGVDALQQIAGSTHVHGHWVTILPSFSRTIIINNWTTFIRLDGQWASEPLISNEQFGIGGVNSVRGYHEGEVFGDSGWHASLEEQTPAHIIGTVYDGETLSIRGSAYTDLATVYLLDPQGRPPASKLWGTGVGLMAGVGSHWQAQFLFSVPLISTVDVPRFNPYFNFSLSAQF
jgi:hypothetical protein